MLSTKMLSMSVKRGSIDDSLVSLVMSVRFFTEKKRENDVHR